MPGTFVGILSGSEGSWTYTLLVGGAGAVTAGVPRMTLASDDPAVALLGTIDTDTGNIVTSVQLLDDTVATLGTTTYTEAATKGLIIGAVRRDADTTLVDTTNEVGPLQMNAAGQLKVECFSGETLPVSLTSTTVTGTVAVTQSGTWDEVGINDSGNSITVDAPVGTPVFVRLSDGASAITELAVVDGNAVTELQNLNGAVYLDDADFTDNTNRFMLGGGWYQSTPQTITDGDVGPFQVTANGYLIVSVNGTLTVASHAVTNAGTFVTQENGALLTAAQLIDDIVYTDDTSTHATGTSKGALIMAAAVPTDTSVSANDIGAVAMTTDRKLHVAVMDALPAGTAAIGKLASNSGVTIGAVEIAAAQTLATVTTVTTVTTCSTVTTVGTLTGGGVAHDGVDSGNPVKIGARAAATLSDDTMVANADRTDAVSDLDGAMIVRSGFPLGDLISEAVSNTDGASTAFTNFGATASTRNYVTLIHAFRTDAGTSCAYIDFRDGTGGAVLYRIALPPNGGAILGTGETPLFKTTANTALAFDVSAALSTIYISITGFKSKVVA